MRKLTWFVVLIVTATAVDAVEFTGGVHMFVCSHLLRIVTQPVDHPNALAGAKVVFSVVADGGEPPLSYQWCKNGTLNYIAGATQEAFTIPSAQVADNGNYACIVSDSRPVGDGGPQVLVSNSAVLNVVPVVLNPELTYTHAVGASVMTAIFNAHNRTLREMLSSPGILPVGKTLADVTKLELVFKVGTDEHVVRYGIVIPTDGDSGVITINGADAVKWNNISYPFEIAGFNGQVRMSFMIGIKSYGASNTVVIQSLIQGAAPKVELAINDIWRDISTP